MVGRCDRQQAKPVECPARGAEESEEASALPSCVGRERRLQVGSAIYASRKTASSSEWTRSVLAQSREEHCSAAATHRM